MNARTNFAQVVRNRADLFSFNFRLIILRNVPVTVAPTRATFADSLFSLWLFHKLQ